LPLFYDAFNPNQSSLFTYSMAQRHRMKHTRCQHSLP
jgi:hypothetical protein